MRLELTEMLFYINMSYLCEFTDYILFYFVDFLSYFLCNPGFFFNLRFTKSLICGIHFLLQEFCTIIFFIVLMY